MRWAYVGKQQLLQHNPTLVFKEPYEATLRTSQHQPTLVRWHPDFQMISVAGKRGGGSTLCLPAPNSLSA
jgi:hypothetical protein